MSSLLSGPTENIRKMINIIVKTAGSDDINNDRDTNIKEG